MAALVILLSVATGTLGIIVALLTIREKLWPRPKTPHPLTTCVNMQTAVLDRSLTTLNTSLREIAAAIYELKQEQP